MRRRRIARNSADRYLTDGETVVHETRQHPIVLMKPMLVWLASTFAALAIGFLVSPRVGASLIDNVLGGMLLAVTAYALWNILHWRTARYVITESRVLVMDGLLAIKVYSIPFSKVTDTALSRSIWGRVFGYGDLLLDTAGDRPGVSTLSYLPHSDMVYRLVASLIDGPVDDSRAARTDPAPSDPDDTGPLPRVAL